MVKALGKIRYKIVQSIFSSRGVFVFISFIITALIFDTSIVKISAYTGGLTSSASNIAIFGAMVVIFCAGQYIILNYVKGRNHVHDPYSNVSLRRLHKSVSVIQYSLIVIFGVLMLQIVFTSSYSLLLIEMIVWINYLLAVGLLAVLSRRFVWWFKSNHNAIVLAYAVAIMMICTNSVSILLYLTNQFTHSFSGPMVSPELTPVARYSSLYDVFNAAYVVTSVMSFILTWFATVLLLHSYSRSLGKAKYWLLVSVPLVYFLSQFQSVFVDLFTSFRVSDPILFGVVFTLFFDATVPVGGALFGIAFWSVARKIESVAVKRYMMISAYGIMLLFSSNQATELGLVPYPPFGLATISFFGLSSLLIFSGIYSSALSVAQDTQLRKSIRGYAIEETRLLDSIGTAQMEQQIEKRVLTLAKRNQDKMAEESGIQSSLSQDDMKQYLERVLEEVQKQKASPTSE